MASQDPPHLAYDRETYLAVSGTLPPKDLPPSSTSTASSQSSQPTSSSSHSTFPSETDSQSQPSLPSSLAGSLKYVGPIGELGSDEHLYKLPLPTEQPTRPEVEEVKKWLEGEEGVKGVEVMVPKKRAKRMFEGE